MKSLLRQSKQLLSLFYLKIGKKSLHRQPAADPKQIKNHMNKEIGKIGYELGQPTHWTHPHLFSLDSHPLEKSINLDEQVTPGITKQEFYERRNKYVNYLIAFQNVYFSSKLSQQEKSSLVSGLITAERINHDGNFIAIIPSSVTTHMSPDVPHTFKQNSDFLYLTGFKEPNSTLVLSKTPFDANYKTALFVREKNFKSELWEGPCTGAGNVDRLCGISNAFSTHELKGYLDSLAKEVTKSNQRAALYKYPTENVLAEHGPNCVNMTTENIINEFLAANSSVIIDMSEQELIDASSVASYFNSSRYFVQLCRVVKSPSELHLMRRASDIASEAFRSTYKVSHSFINEHLLYAKFDFECRLRGADYLSYIPVVAGGSRATVLHYIRNNQIIPKGQMVLMDAGCQFADYSSDITRTWPVSGQYTGAQRDLYEACLNVQKHCLSVCTPGRSILDMYFVMMRKMGEHLSELGLIEK